MGMTGLQIYKLLPRTNCKECSFASCLAFGMALASGKTEAGKCPHMPEELRARLADAALPPVRESVFGFPVQFRAGGEKVMYRHEETFYNRPCIAPVLPDSLDDAVFSERASFAASFREDRAGSELSFGAVAVLHDGGDLGAKALLVPEGKPVILVADDPSVVGAALDVAGGGRPLVVCRGASPEDLSDWSKRFGCAVCVFGGSPEELHERAESLKDCPNIFFAFDGPLGDAVSCMAVSRRSSVFYRQGTRPFVHMVAGDGIEALMESAAVLLRYAGCILVPFGPRESLLPLLELSACVYSDPRRPVQTEPGLYPINSPDENSPVFVTTNFSLTHFLVSSEIEASRRPVWLVIADTDGTSLLTAWAADKFNASVIGKALQKSGVAEKVSHRTLVISSHVASLKDEIERETGWRALIGSGDSSGISPWLKKFSPEMLWRP